MKNKAQTLLLLFNSNTSNFHLGKVIRYVYLPLEPCQILALKEVFLPISLTGLKGQLSFNNTYYFK